ncbi:MAG: hypothetical protein ACKO99_01850 [Dolichospermum sp.]
MSYDSGDAAAQPATIGASIFTYQGTDISVKLNTFFKILTQGKEPLVIVISTVIS